VPLSGVARTSQGWAPVLDPRCLLAPGEALALREAVQCLLSGLPPGIAEGGGSEPP
jgi:hypothetical protein